MLDLQPRVHFEEEEVLAVVVVEELDRARGSIAARARERLGRVPAAAAARRRAMPGRRRLLDHLLIAALRRAVALAEREDAAVRRRRRSALRCGARARQSARGTRRPGRSSRRPAARQRRSARADPRGVAADAHADAAAAGGALQHHGIAAALRLRQPRAPRPSAGRCRAAAARRLATAISRARVLQPERAHLLRRRAEEHDPGALAGFGEVGVLAQESVARMNRFGAGLARRVENCLLVQVALSRRRRAEPNARRPAPRAAQCRSASE